MHASVYYPLSSSETARVFTAGWRQKTLVFTLLVVSLSTTKGRLGAGGRYGMGAAEGLRQWLKRAELTDE